MATFEESISEIVSRVNTYKDSIKTEEATKTSFVLPFITRVLGYDIFDPHEVVPEFTCDVGIKKGEKVDYAILKDGKVQIIIEVKSITDTLRSEYSSQLIRYFGAAEARIAILTNGQLWEFYTDLDRPNIMDARPFLKIDLLDFNPGSIQEIKRLSKDSFDIDAVVSSAKTLKYISAFKDQIQKELDIPSQEFVTMLARRVYPGGRLTSNMLEFFTDISRKAAKSIVNERINARLKSALVGNVNDGNVSFDSSSNSTDQTAVEEQGEKYETTEEEIYAFLVVKSILANHVDPELITYRDRLQYFAIFYGDNSRKPICRFYFNSEKTKYITVFDARKDSQRFEISKAEDIYNYAAELINVAVNYSAGGNPPEIAELDGELLQGENFSFELPNLDKEIESDEEEFEDEPIKRTGSRFFIE